MTVLLARTTAQLQAVERELAEERVKLEYTEEEILEMERKEEQAEAVQYFGRLFYNLLNKAANKNSWMFHF